jgi:hypothetical protein
LVELSGSGDQAFGKILPESPISFLVGIGQSRLGDRLQKTQMIKRFGLRIQTRFDIPKTIAPS